MLKLLDIKGIILSIILFLLGYILAGYIYQKKIKFLLAYPLWFTEVVKKFFIEKHISFILLILLIFSFNSLSIFTLLISAFIKALPIILVLWLGINLGVSIFHLNKGEKYYLMLFNPVAVMELTATFITASASLQYNFNSKLNITSILKPIYFKDSIDIYIKFVLPILFISATVESALIIILKRFDSNNH